MPHTPSENQYRMAQFEKNYERIQKLKVKYHPRTKFGVNKFALNTAKEFEVKLKGTTAMTEKDIRMIQEGEFDNLRKSKMKKQNRKSFKYSAPDLVDLRVNQEKVKMREESISEQKRMAPHITGVLSELSENDSF